MKEQGNRHQRSPKKVLYQLRAAEKALELQIEQLYADCVGYSLKNVQCAFINASELYVCVEGMEYPFESFLEDWGSVDLLEQMRQAVKQIVGQKIKDTVETELSIEASELRHLKPDRRQQLNMLVSLD